MTGSMSGARIGLVLGAGGVVGGAFHAGVLAALHEATGWDARRASVVVGTSAGSITGASLRAGFSAPDLLARSEGRPLSEDGARLAASLDLPARPASPQPGGVHPRALGDLAATLARAAARPLSARPTALLAGLLPEGSVGTEVIAGGVARLYPGPWPTDPLWVCAVRRRDGRRVVFGRDAFPPVPEAVAASCAVPGWFRSVAIEGEAYIDGGVHSPTNADLLGDAAGVHLVLVSSPMSHTGGPTSVRGLQPVRRWSRVVLDGESVRLRRRGAHVVAFQPTPEDVAVMGANAMNPGRRAVVARQARESTLRRLDRAGTRARLAALGTG